MKWRHIHHKVPKQHGRLAHKYLLNQNQKRRPIAADYILLLLPLPESQAGKRACIITDHVDNAFNLKGFAQ
jgi:hypothetical protein